MTTLFAPKIYKCAHENRVPAGMNLIFIYKADPLNKISLAPWVGF